jgi:hypothetical protein
MVMENTLTMVTKLQLATDPLRAVGRSACQSLLVPPPTKIVDLAPRRQLQVA